MTKNFKGNQGTNNDDLQKPPPLDHQWISQLKFDSPRRSEMTFSSTETETLPSENTLFSKVVIQTGRSENFPGKTKAEVHQH